MSPPSVGSEEPEPLRSGTCSVLLVDDDAGIREAVSGLLADEGYEVVAAENGLRALQLLYRGLRPKIVLLDIMMPLMNGMEFRAHQILDPGLANIPVAVVSAAGLNREEVRRQFGAVTFLSKPFSAEELLDVIRDVPCANRS